MTVEDEAPVAQPSFWKRAVGYLVAGACLVWVFHDIHVERMFSHIGSMNWWWVLPAVACDILGYVCDAARWRSLLVPVGRLSLIHAVQAVYAGLFTNEVTPMRFGELVRIYLAGKWVGRPLPEIIPSMLVSRLLDGVWMAIGIGVVAIFMPLPRDLLMAADIFGIVVLALVGAFLFLVFGETQVLARWASHSSSRGGLVAWLHRTVLSLTRGLQAIGDWRTMAAAGIYSLGFAIFQILAFWLIMQSYNLWLPLSAGAAVYLIVHFGTALPNAPANVGSYQFFAVLGLSLFGVEKTMASGFSVVVFILLTLPLWILGLVALSRTGMTLRMIRADIRSSFGSASHPD